MRDEVKIIAHHGPVLIVENEKGCFPVQASLVAEGGKIEEPVIAEETLNRGLTIVAPPLKKKQQKSQPQLF